MSARTIVKKIVLGTPVRRVAAATESIANITEFDASDQQHLDIFVYDSNTGKYTSSRLAVGGEINETYDSATNTLSINLPQLATAGTYGSPNELAAFEIDSFGRVITAAEYSLSNIIDSDYVQNRINFDSIASDLIPDSNGIRSLGSAEKRWQNLWLSGDNLYIGGVSIKESDGSLILQSVDDLGNVEEDLGTISGGPDGISVDNIKPAVDVDLSGTTQQLLDTFSMGSFRSAKYFVQLEDNTNNNFGSAELLLMHDSADVFLLEFARISTGAYLGEFDATVDQSEETVNLFFTPTSSTVSVKAKRLISGI